MLLTPVRDLCNKICLRADLSRQYIKVWAVGPESSKPEGKVGLSLSLFFSNIRERPGWRFVSNVRIGAVPEIYLV